MNAHRCRLAMRTSPTRRRPRASPITARSIAGGAATSTWKSWKRASKGRTRRAPSAGGGSSTTAHTQGASCALRPRGSRQPGRGPSRTWTPRRSLHHVHLRLLTANASVSRGRRISAQTSGEPHLASDMRGSGGPTTDDANWAICGTRAWWTGTRSRQRVGKSRSLPPAQWLLSLHCLHDKKLPTNVECSRS